MSSGHTHNRNGRGNQRRKHGPPRQQPQNAQSQNGQPQPRGQSNSSPRSTAALSMTALPARAEAPFQAPDTPSLGGEGQFMIIESVTAEIREVTLEVEVEAPALPERPAPMPPRPAQQRNTQPPGKRGPFLIPPERQSVADNGARSSEDGSKQHLQASSPSHMQPAPPEPSDLARARRGEHDALPPSSYGMSHTGAGDTDDEDAEYVVHERRPQRDVRGDVGTLIDSLHDLFSQDRTIASQGNATRCGICYLHYSLSELEYREAEGYYVCADCKRALGSTQLVMVRRQQRN